MRMSNDKRFLKNIYTLIAIISIILGLTGSSVTGGLFLPNYAHISGFDLNNNSHLLHFSLSNRILFQNPILMEMKRNC